MLFERKASAKIQHFFDIRKFFRNFYCKNSIFSIKMKVNLTYSRRKTTTTHVGSLCIGSDFPIRIQTMANTSTDDIEGSVAQAKRCFEAGAELLRFTTQGLKQVESLRQIKECLNSEALNAKPLVADIHFQSAVADAAAQVVEKVRINPGNYIDPARTFKHLEYTDEEYAAELQRLRDRFCILLDICRQNHTAIRIGVNHGSLSDRIMSRYGDTPAGIAESCMEFLRVARDEHFDDIVISVKASNTRVMVDSVRLLVAAMDREDMHYPLHLGVTEAGEGEDGRIKSAVGIGALLAEGIGDTIRVSLSEAPENELPVARALVDYFTNPDSPRYNGVKVEIEGDKLIYTYPSTPLALGRGDGGEATTLFTLHAAAECGRLLWEHGLSKLEIKCANDSMNQSMVNGQWSNGQLSKDILQAAGVIRYKTEYISCPGCGRTLFQLEDTIARVKKAIAEITDPALRERVSHLKIGIMGCIVNGPGEMADADYGYVGAGRDRISLYKNKECVLKNIPQEEAVDRLLELIKTSIPTTKE